MKFFVLLLFFLSCQSKQSSQKQLVVPKKIIKRKKKLLDSNWIDISELDTNIVIDIKYATKDNFTKSKLYACGRCVLAPKVANKLALASKYFKGKGYKLHIWDCYRPHFIQKKMWKLVPNPIYVSDPKKGSMHNRGMAIDVTLSKEGKLMDMGTDYDYFGKKAHSNYPYLSKAQLKNRKILKMGLLKFGFKGITSEWWHYSFREKGYWRKVENYKWPCVK